MKRIFRRKRIIGSILIVLLLVTLLNIKVSAYTETGHEDFTNIDINPSVKLLVEYKDSEIDKLVDKMPWKFFGWSNSYINYEIKMKYDGKVIFARSNKTSQVVKIDYSLQEIQTTKTSVSVKGTVSTKISGKIKKINTDIIGNVEFESSRQESNEYEIGTKTVISMVVKPMTKLSLITTGDARLTNGVSKYSLFGFTTRKGGWERIDVETVYYEFREEQIE